MDANFSYSNHGVSGRITEPVAIVGINFNGNPPQATAMMRSREYIKIDLSHMVGAVQVTPSIGDQWLAIKDRGIWKLERQLPHNMEPKPPAVEGQVRIGSRGPTELDGSQINFNAPTRSLTASTSSRPQASSVPIGSQIYDTTLNKPLWSDGTSWRDAAGSAV